MKIKGILLTGNAGTRKEDGKKYLFVNVLFDSNKSLTGASVHTIFAGADYVGNYDLTGFKVFDEVEIEYNQPFGSKYIQLIDIKKVK